MHREIRCRIVCPVLSYRYGAALSLENTAHVSERLHPQKV
jgi:hypothetical protein